MQLILHPPSPPPTIIHPTLSRRVLATVVGTSAALPLLFPIRHAAAQEPGAGGCTSELPITARAFLDVAIGGEPAGRVTVGLYGSTAPVGAARFVSLATGIGYRRKEFTKIMPGRYIQHGGVISVATNPELLDRLIEEMDALIARCGPPTAVKNVAWSVAIVVRDPNMPPPKPKLVARKGRLEIDKEEVGVAPNATEFTIAVSDAPELDAAALVIGRVVEGMEVVKRISEVKTVKENSSSPYFRVAKLIGDKRAVVAERGFNRPYTKVIVANCGLAEN